MQTITWGRSCYFRHRPITGGVPTVLFATGKPMFVGVIHDTCYGDKPNFGRYQVKVPSHLSPERVAFLLQFYPMLFALPNALSLSSDMGRLTLCAVVQSTLFALKVIKGIFIETSGAWDDKYAYILERLNTLLSQIRNL